MLQFLIISTLCCIPVATVLLCASFRAFDRLLRQVKSDSDAAWIALGRPCGFFWVPSGILSLTASGHVRTALYSQWSSSTAPPAGDPATLARLRRFKRLAAALYVAALLQFVLAVGLLWG
jgi:hypothetical protein